MRVLLRRGPWPSPAVLVRASFRNFVGHVPKLSEHRFVFICGLHKSGTSIVHRLLRSHPDVSGLCRTGVPEDEGQHLQSVVPPAGHFGGPGRFAFDRQAHMTEFSDLVTRENQQELLRQWGLYWDFRKKVLLEKSPPNIIRSRFLKEMFKEASFIYVVRHPIPTSLATQKWSKTSIDELLRHWFTAHRIMLSDMEHITKYLIIRYEDFVERSEDTFSEILSYLGLQSISISEAVENKNNVYFKTWNKCVGESNTDLSVYNENHLRILSFFGYRLDDPFVEVAHGQRKFDARIPMPDTA